MNRIYPGIYQHFKGTYCTVLAVCEHTEHDGEMYVCYEHRNERGIPTYWVRPLQMFAEEVTGPDGTKVPRFTRYIP